MRTMSIIILFLGLTTSLFMYWRRLKEDYGSDLVFRSYFSMFLNSLIFAFLFKFILTDKFSKVFYFDPHDLWFWGGFLGYIVSLIFVVRKFSVNLFEIFEASIVSFIVFMGFVYLQNTISMSNPVSLGLSILTVLLIILFFVLDKRYKSFSWYKSGKVGFAGIFCASLFFLIRSVVAITIPNVVSLVGRVDSLISITVSFILFFVIYNLATKI